MKMEFSAGGIVYKKTDAKTEFVLILNSDKIWTLPKGHIEKNEKPRVAALREVKEEIGLKKIEIDQDLEKINYWFKKGDFLIHKYVYFFLMQSFDRKLKPQLEEISGAGWFSKEEVLQKITFKEDEILFLQAFKFLSI